jgi:hypothetical protein
MLNLHGNKDCPESPNISARSEESLNIEQKLPKSLSITPPPQESYRIQNFPKVVSQLEIDLFSSPIRFNADGGRISKVHAIGGKTFKHSDKKKTTLVNICQQKSLVNFGL